MILWETIVKWLMTSDTFLSKDLTILDAVRSDTAKRLGIDNAPDKRQIEVMRHLALHLYQPIVDFFDTPVYVSSMFRSKELNKAIGGSSTSHHMVLGDTAAIDIDQDAIATTVSNRDIFYFVYDYMDYETLIWEYGDRYNPNWVHISFSMDKSKNKRKRTLRATRVDGKTIYTNFNEPT